MEEEIAKAKRVRVMGQDSEYRCIWDKAPACIKQCPLAQLSENVDPPQMFESEHGISAWNFEGRGDVR